MSRYLWVIAFILISASYVSGQTIWIDQPVANGYDGAWGIFPIDMDGDNDIDLVSAAYYEQDITWWENDGNLNFIEHIVDSNWNGVYEVHAGDLDSDGDMEIIGVSYNSNEIAWYENDGSMNFTKFSLVTNYPGAHFARMEDIDGDSDMDIAGCAMAAGYVTWWENTGYPVFQRHNIDSTLDGCRQIEVFDLDNDHDMDIIAAGEAVNQIVWYENNGSEQFTKHVIQGNYKAFWVKPYDFNNDNSWDLLSCSAGPNDDISWFENDGSMNFTKHLIDNVVNDPQSVDAADFDFDGDLDIVAAVRHNDAIFWWENDQNNVFTKYLVKQNFDYAVSVAAADIDLDGDSDIIGSAFNSGRIDWFRYSSISNPGWVAGVVNDNFGSPVESVYVSDLVYNFNTYTDSCGNYVLPLPGGAFDISFQKFGYEEYIEYGVNVLEGDTLTLDVTLQKIPTGFALGYVMDDWGDPMENVHVYAEFTDFGDSTDENGEYYFEVSTGLHTLYYVYSGYNTVGLNNVLFTLNDTTYLDTVYMVPAGPAVRIWYGNRDLSPVAAPIGDTVLVDVYAQTSPPYNFAFIHLPLGTDDQYIVGQHSISEGLFYYPLTEWDVAEFLVPEEYQTGWHSQSLLGFCDIGGGPHPYLVCPFPTKIASFAFEIADDISIVGDTVNCMEEGYSAPGGGPLFGDSTGIEVFVPRQYFSPFYFVTSGGPEIYVWYGNTDGSPVSAIIGDTVMIDVYVQSSDPVNLDSLHLPIAVRDQYITGSISETAGIMYAPLTNWDEAQFLPANELYPGWHSQSLAATADTGGSPNPYLQCTVPTRIASFAFIVSNDVSILGDTAECFMEGSHPVYGSSRFRDSTGFSGYNIYQGFAPLHFLEPPPPEISVWYGNTFSSPIAAPIGDTVLIDVYIQSSVLLNIDSLHLALASADQYISQYVSGTAGILYSPLTEWDAVEFLTPNFLSPGWHSQSLIAASDTGGAANPYLQCLEPTRIASFALKIINDTSLVGDTVDCFIGGLNPIYGGTFIGDSASVGHFYPNQYFSSLRFIESGGGGGGCDYIVGDVNNSGAFNGLDITFGVNYFKGGTAPPNLCECTPGSFWYVAGDVNGNCVYNGLDITYGVAYLKGGPSLLPCPDCPPIAEPLINYRIPYRRKD